MIGRRITAAFCLALLLATSTTARAQNNLLKNGSFEGSTRYWFNTSRAALEDTGAAFGSHALRVPKGGYVQSGPFLLETGKPVTVSFSVRADREGEMGMTLVPSHREVAQKAGLAWNMSKFRARVGPEWRRASFTFTPTVPQEKPWWPAPVYMLQIGGSKEQPFIIDGVSVAYDAGDKTYVPRREVEVVADARELPGYKSPTANLLKPGQTVNVTGLAYNPSDEGTPRRITLRWQVMSYDGARPVGPAIDKPLTLAANQTAAQTVALKLAANGLQLARVSALDAAGKVIDRSDMPLTVLPYPKKATTPDWGERFGTSLRGPHTAQLAQRIGFRWSRWYPQINWGTVQPDGPDTWKWPDAQIDMLLRHGFAIDLVLWGKPKWAFEGKSHLPKDMPWAADDPRWDDLSTETGWDRFVAAAAKRYAGKPIAWEFQNEPELERYEDERIYRKLAERTAKVLKKADPKAFYLVNSTWPGPTPLYNRYFEQGGARFIDAFSWHNYRPGEAGDAATVRRIRTALNTYGGKNVQIWFNEGWTFINSSTDYPALPITDLSAPEAAHVLVRSIADMTAAGQERFIPFFLGYEEHGHSWWDFYGPGTELWDFAEQPLIAVPAYNVLIHHLGLSQPVGTIRPPGATLHVFEDKRNRRGVLVAWADKDNTALDLPLTGVVAEDIMGNQTPLPAASGKTRLVLRTAGRPVYLFTSAKLPGKTLDERLTPLDTARLPVASAAGVYRLPPEWTGTEAGSTTGNPLTANGGPLWRLDQVWPDDPTKPQNYRALPWGAASWKAREHEHGGQPDARIEAGSAHLAARGAWGGNPGEKLPALVFIAPKAGRYQVRGRLSADVWDGGGPVSLRVLQKDSQAVSELKTYRLQSKQPVDLAPLAVTLEAGQELVFVPRFGRHNVAATFTLKDLQIAASGGK
jgi:hypothetical protein